MGHFLRLILGIFLLIAGFVIEIIESSIVESIRTDMSTLPINPLNIVQIGVQGFKYLGIFVIIVSTVGILYRAVARDEEQPEEPQNQAEKQPQQPRQPENQQPRENQPRQRRQENTGQPQGQQRDQQETPSRQQPPRSQDQDDEF